MFHGALKKNAYSDFFECNVLKMSIKSIFHTMYFSISVSLVILCLGVLFTGVSGVLKSPTVIVFPSISPFMSASICWTYLGAPIIRAYILMIVISSS